MKVQVAPEMAQRLRDLAAASGRAPEQVVEDALAGQLEEMASVRQTPQTRYDDLRSGRVEAIGGEASRRLGEKRERRSR